MIRRGFPLVMALTLALCPVALDVCQVACAEHQQVAAVPYSSAGRHHHAQPADPMPAHQHADAAAFSAGTASRIPAYTVREVGHACLHGENLSAFVGTNLQLALAPAAMVPTLFTLPGPTSSTRGLADAGSVAQSLPITLTTQLRV